MKKILQIVLIILLLFPLGKVIWNRVQLKEPSGERFAAVDMNPDSPGSSGAAGTAGTAEPGTFVLSAIGDCTLASNENFIYSDYGYNARMDGDYAYPFSNTVQYFTADDFTIANLECVLSDKDRIADYHAQFHFKAPADYAQILTAGGVDFVTTANNHLLEDYGEKGAQDTYEALEQYGVPYGKDGQAQIVTTDSGLVLGVYCAYNNLKPDKDQAVAAVEQLKAQGAEYILCMFHWGEELKYTLRDADIELAHACVDAGASLIYGSHSHMLQPIERYHGAVILYGMGNWTFGGSTMPTYPETAIVQITVDRAADGSVSNRDVSIIPCSVSSQPYVANTHYNDYRPTPYEEGSEEYARVLSMLDGSFQPEHEGKDYSDWWAQKLQS